MPIGDATEMMDTWYPYFRLPEAGYELIVAGPEARLYHGVMHEIPPEANVPWDITREQASYHIRADGGLPSTSTPANTPACSSRAVGRRSISATTKTCCG